MFFPGIDRPERGVKSRGMIYVAWITLFGYKDITIAGTNVF
jgi:hypothetical protein